MSDVLSAIHEELSKLSEDKSIPKNIRGKLLEACELLEECLNEQDSSKLKTKLQDVIKKLEDALNEQQQSNIIYLNTIILQMISDLERVVNEL
jgi:uncharacterized protein (UPF0147 family)